MTRVAWALPLLGLLLVPQPAAAADDQAAIDACRQLLPVFVTAPVDPSVEIQDRGDREPFGVRIAWPGSADGPGWILCWFLPRASTPAAWQYTHVQSSRFGELRRYDVQQAFKMLRIKGRPATAAPAPGPPPMLYLAQQLVNVLALACVYALLAVAFTLTASTAGVTNLAFGQFATLGAWLFLTVRVASLLMGEWPLVLILTVGCVACALTGGLLGVAADRLVFRPLRRAARTTSVALIASIGLAIVLEEIVRLSQGARPRYMMLVRDARIVLIKAPGFDVSITAGHLVIAAATCVVALALWLLLTGTRLGLRLRAVSQDRQTAALLGVDVDRTIAGAFALSGALGGLAGMALAAEYGVVNHAMGASITLKALTGALLGGIGSVPGAFLGAAVVAAAEGIGAGYGSSAWKDVYAFAILIALMVFRPHGLMGVSGLRASSE